MQKTSELQRIDQTIDLGGIGEVFASEDISMNILNILKEDADYQCSKKIK